MVLVGIVREKGDETYRVFLKTHALTPSACWMIGNSPKGSRACLCGRYRMITHSGGALVPQAPGVPGAPYRASMVSTAWSTALVMAESSGSQRASSIRGQNT